MMSQEEEDRRLGAALDQSARRKGGRTQPKRLADVVSRLLAKQGYAQVVVSDVMHTAWAEAAGPKLAKLSQPGRLRGGKLEIVATTSVVVQELTFQKAALLSRLRQLAPEAKIDDLRFRHASLGG